MICLMLLVMNYYFCVEVYKSAPQTDCSFPCHPLHGHAHLVKLGQLCMCIECVCVRVYELSRLCNYKQ